MTPAARPFPWGALDAVSAADAVAARALTRWGSTHGRAEAVEEALTSLLDTRVEVLVRRVRGAGAGAGGEEWLAVVVSASGTSARDAALVAVEPALAAALVARALRRPRPRLIEPAEAAARTAGTLAAVVVATARRVHVGGAMRVVAAGPARGLERDLAAENGALVEASLTVLLSDEAYAARLLVPRAAAFAVPAARWTRAALAALGDVPLPLSIVAATSHATAAEIGSLRRGDAWVPHAWGLHRTPAGTLAGPVVLAAAAHETGIRATLGEDGRIVVREGTETLAWTPADREENAKRMSDSDRNADALIDAVGEVPVVVRVEIGVAEMRAREWASLGAGDVVALGQKIGESVTLRVGGVAVARGELVDLEGEVGVRILGRTAGER